MTEPKSRRPGLLVSVRSVVEAHAALAGGASLIDVKEPANGALGRADDAIIASIAREVEGRVPVSAALGEWTDANHAIPDADLTYVKWGFAGCRDQEWRHVSQTSKPQVVLVAYADWECARAPSVDDVFAFAAFRANSVMLVDTFCKTAALGKAKPTLLDWLPVAWIEDLCERAREKGVRIALAGSLGANEIRALRSAAPDWFAVRGAVCSSSDRGATVEIARVRNLVNLLVDCS